MTATPDPILTRRARIAFWVRLGKRVGYTALLVAICVAGLITAIVVLPAPIVFGYGIKAAEREERGGSGH